MNEKQEVFMEEITEKDYEKHVEDSEVSGETSPKRKRGGKRLWIELCVLVILIVGGMFAYCSLYATDIDKPAWQEIFDLTPDNDRSFRNSKVQQSPFNWLLVFDGKHGWQFSQDGLMNLVRKDYGAADYDELYNILSDRYRELFEGGASLTVVSAIRYRDVRALQKRLCEVDGSVAEIEQAYRLEVAVESGTKSFTEQFFVYLVGEQVTSIPCTESVRSILNEFE